MAAINQTTVQDFFDVGDNGASTAEKGRALEDLVCYIFAQIPGISIVRRNEMNTFETEEIDVALWNEAHNDGLYFLSNIILVECKNWSNAVSSNEVSWFDAKLRSRGLNFGILVAANGITGNANDVTAAHQIIASALREKRHLIVFTRDELLALSDSSELVRKFKEKLCDLAVNGTIM